MPNRAAWSGTGARRRRQGRQNRVSGNPPGAADHPSAYRRNVSSTYPAKLAPGKAGSCVPPPAVRHPPTVDCLRNRWPDLRPQPTPDLVIIGSMHHLQTLDLRQYSCRVSSQACKETHGHPYRPYQQGEGSIAGFKVSEHIVDTCGPLKAPTLYVFASQQHQNRFGSTAELGIYGETGLRQGNPGTASAKTKWATGSGSLMLLAIEMCHISG